VKKKEMRAGRRAKAKVRARRRSASVAVTELLREAKVARGEAPLGGAKRWPPANRRDYYEQKAADREKRELKALEAVGLSRATLVSVHVLLRSQAPLRARDVRALAVLSERQTAVVLGLLASSGCARRRGAWWEATGRRPRRATVVTGPCS